ncbi:hypothetical protein ES677_02640 [Bizionia gelidisalsuginis]|uniref:Uncharacterized protein n=2 Tax=Bizionia TaxID=283785 RepID=A0A8H2QGK7_9FLAO|nr:MULTISPECIES: hypothetical protein [Bizionia]TYB80251.1 hypothetical protein ES676_00865 [Bizionia saleffrena]TYC17094.1 hypothetical protein ES677_02640 [Bizionia gelidisalsuginis]
MPKKICIISFDHWDYDKHIAIALKKKGIDSYHIKIGNYKHASVFDKITNALSKVFLNKNLKKLRRQDFIVHELDRLGFQDQILVINPEVIDLEHHLQIKKRTNKYIAYLYDSMERNPITHLLDGIFDSIYSFDANDVAQYNFLPITNYNYLTEVIDTANEVYDAVYVGSLDDRVPRLIDVAARFKKMDVTFKCLILGKNRKLVALKTKGAQYIEFKDDYISQEHLIEEYKKAKVIVDFVRENQTGLSFRFFEALALKKKVITNNKNVLNYSFYNPNNIFVMDESNTLPSKDFFAKNYEELKQQTYNKYTIEKWIEKVFNLK